MALLPNINVGSSPNDGTGDSIRDAFVIVNENFQLIEAFFPNSSVANLVANIESTGTSVFNIANVDVLNVNTVSSFTTTDITATNITVDSLSANTITGFTVSGNITANIESTGNSSFNITSHSGAATFDDTVFIGTTLTVDTIDANVGNIDTINNGVINSNSVSVTGNIDGSSSLNITGGGYFGSLNTGSVTATGNLLVQGTFNVFSDNAAVIFQGNIKANSKFSINTVTISSDVNLAVNYGRAQTIVANLTAGNITVTLPNADIPYSDGHWLTFICYDESASTNRTLTVNVQPSAANIWTSANTQNTFVNIGAELGTNSVNLKTNETYWFTS